MLLNVPCARPKRPLSTTTSITVWTRSSIRRARGPVHRWMSSRRSPSTCEEATMSDSSALPLIGAVAAVGVLHTVVPDHWVPITLIARQRGWSRAETARAALVAGIGHGGSTLAIAIVVWVAGAGAAKQFGHVVDALASAPLVAFGGWIAISALLD